MANARLIKRRMKSAGNIAQITKAMQMVAASKMKKAQNQAVAGKPYSEKLQTVLASLLKSSTQLKHELLTSRQEPNIAAMLFVTSNKGLCGGLNTNHFRKLHNWLGNQDLDQMRFVTVGKKGREFILKMGGQVAADFSDLPEHFTFEDTLPIARLILKLFKDQEINTAFASYTNFISTLSQEPKVIQLLPITQEALRQSLGALDDKAETETPQFQTKEYLIEPSSRKIVNWVLPYFVELEVFHFLLEATASEHSARMVAMKNASENANELVSELNLEYNQIRQQLITAEISDIVTAWKALQ